jgi:hypothetical protein
MKNSVFYIVLLSAFLLYSCSKEKFPRVEYKVTANSSVNVAYTMTSGSLSTENVSGSWSKSFRHSQGGSVFLSATHSGFGTTTISVYVNKQLMWSQSSNFPGETIQIFEVIP